MQLDFFNSIGNKLNDSLHNLDKSIHSNIKDTFIDNFIHELQNYLNKSDALHQLSKLPQNTKLEINEIEDKYVSCYEPNTFDKYDIPKELVDFSSKQQGYFSLQLQNDGLYHYVSKD
ncbi:MAG: hypothetical protein FWF46_07305 [Oscillospiraceae bacterium]|nr:hypothetical protein [Oscillospiraceae bacterium]